MFSPQSLLPTTREAHFHGLRVHHQVRTWLLNENEQCDATEWGWVNVNKTLTPVDDEYASL